MTYIEEEKIQRTIALILGWCCLDTGIREFWSPPNSKASHVNFPKWHDDLNACHEFEKSLTPELWPVYCEKLRLCTLNKTDAEATHASALQRCIAFISTHSAIQCPTAQ